MGYVGRGQVRDNRQGVCGQGGRSETVDMGYVGRGQVRDNRQGVCGQGVGQRQ